MTLSLFLKDAKFISSLQTLILKWSEVGLKLFSVWLALEKLKLLCCSVWRSLLGRYASHHATSNRVNGHYGRPCFLLNWKLNNVNSDVQQLQSDKVASKLLVDHGIGLCCYVKRFESRETLVLCIELVPACENCKSISTSQKWLKKHHNWEITVGVSICNLNLKQGTMFF